VKKHRRNDVNIVMQILFTVIGTALIMSSYSELTLTKVFAAIGGIALVLAGFYFGIVM